MRSIRKFNEEWDGDDKLSNWELESKISKAISSNMREIPYEGTEVDTEGMKYAILEIIYEICPEYKK